MKNGMDQVWKWYVSSVQNKIRAGLLSAVLAVFVLNLVINIWHGAQAINLGSVALLIEGLVAIGFVAERLIQRLIVQPLQQAVRVLQVVAEGDFSLQLDLNSSDEIGQLAQALNRAVRVVDDALRDVGQMANSAAEAAAQLSIASEQLATGAQQQAASLEETAAFLEEMSSTVTQNAGSAEQANQLAQDSRGEAEQGGRIVGGAVASMDEIRAASQKIFDIVTVSNEIAFRTNLLSLNAAVEAAHAGEHGRRFAVVAAEIRTLAQRSAVAAKEIKGLIEDTGQKVATGSELVTQSGQTLEGLVGTVKQVSDFVAEIAAASQEQSAGIEQVAAAMESVQQVTNQNADGVKQIEDAAHNLHRFLETYRWCMLSHTPADNGEKRIGPTEVYYLALAIDQAICRLHGDLSAYTKEKLSLNVKPRNVFQRALGLVEEHHTLFPQSIDASAFALARRKVTTAVQPQDVYRMLTLLKADLVAKRVFTPATEVPSRKTPSYVFHMLRQISFHLQEGARKTGKDVKTLFSPSRVYDANVRQVLPVIYALADAHQLVYVPFEFPTQPIAGVRPHHVYELQSRMYERLADYYETQHGLEPVRLDTINDLEGIAPSDVFDLTQLIIAELQAFEKEVPQLDVAVASQYHAWQAQLAASSVLPGHVILLVQHNLQLVQRITAGHSRECMKIPSAENKGWDMGLSRAA